MQQEILINWSPQETRVAVVESGAVQELHVERSLERGIVGNVYLGKVARVLPGMQSAFIDIGLERAAFLHVADLVSSINLRHAEPKRVIRPTQNQMRLCSCHRLKNRCLKAKRCWCKSSKNPSAPRAHGCQRRSAYLGDCWCFCRKTSTLACRKKFLWSSASN